MSSANSQIMFTALKIPVDRKLLEKDENGYYKVTLGAFNCFNSANEFYVLKGIEELFKESSSLMRRIQNGYLRGEVGHPQFIPGMTTAQYYARNLRIDIENVSHTIKTVALRPTTIPSGLPGKGNHVAVDGWVKPSGVKGDGLQKELDDPDANVAFSIRCFTQNVDVGGVTEKEVMQIITWDWVLEPGIKAANKFDRLNDKAITVESIDILSFSAEEFMSTGRFPTDLYLGLESADERALVDELRTKIQANSSMDFLSRW